MPVYLAEQYVADLTGPEVDALVARVREDLAEADGDIDIVLVVVVPSDELVLYIFRSDSVVDEIDASWPGHIDRLAPCTIEPVTG